MELKCPCCERMVNANVDVMNLCPHCNTPFTCRLKMAYITTIPQHEIFRSAWVTYDGLESSLPQEDRDILIVHKSQEWHHGRLAHREGRLLWALRLHVLPHHPLDADAHYAYYLPLSGDRWAYVPNPIGESDEQP